MDTAPHDSYEGRTTFLGNQQSGIVTSEPKFRSRTKRVNEKIALGVLAIGGCLLIFISFIIFLASQSSTILIYAVYVGLFLYSISRVILYFEHEYLWGEGTDFWLSPSEQENVQQYANFNNLVMMAKGYTRYSFFSISPQNPGWISVNKEDLPFHVTISSLGYPLIAKDGHDPRTINFYQPFIFKGPLNWFSVAFMVDTKGRVYKMKYPYDSFVTATEAFKYSNISYMPPNQYLS